jgi:glycosyltransferase involved in cell wall biosynthesis
MRVLLTTESYLPYLSGVTVSVDSLARGLGTRGHEVLVLAPRPAHGSVPEPVGSPGPAPRYAWLASYQPPVVAPPGYRMPVPLPRSRALREARDFRPDVVHAHSPFVTGRFARRLASEMNAPLVFTHHTRFADYGHYLGPLFGPAGRLTDAYLRRFWTACGAIVAPSGDLARDIRALLPARLADRVHVIPTGVDVAGIRGLAPIDPRVQAGWPADALVVASLGRLAPEKSPELLVEAVAVAAPRLPSLRLLVIGGGPSEAALRARAERPDLVGRICFTGAVPRPEALARLSGADLFLFTSRTETQGIVLAEALTAGLPAVAVDGPGVGESVRDGIDGVVVAHEPADSLGRRLADGIVSLADQPRRAAMAERAAGDADRFAVERRVAQAEELYERLRRT